MNSHISHWPLQRGYSSFGRRFRQAGLATVIVAGTSAHAEPYRVIAEEVQIAQLGGGLGAFGALGEALRKKTEEAIEEIDGLGVRDCDDRANDGNCTVVGADGSDNRAGSGGLQPQTPIADDYITGVKGDNPEVGKSVSPQIPPPTTIFVALPRRGPDLLTSDEADATLEKPPTEPFDPLFAERLVESSDLPVMAQQRLLSAAAIDRMIVAQIPSAEVSSWIRDVALTRHSAGSGGPLTSAWRGLTASEKIETRRLFERFTSAVYPSSYGFGKVAEKRSRDLDGVSDDTFIPKQAQRAVEAFLAERLGMLLSESGNPQCLATLVAPYMVLTARHCLADHAVASNAAQFTTTTDRLRFALASRPEDVLSITSETVRPSFYADRPTVFDASARQHDYVILRLVPPEFALYPRMTPTRFRTVSMGDDLVLPVFNLFTYLADNQPKQRWAEFVLVDDGPTCMVYAVARDGLILHGCNTQNASSGAPMLHVDEDGGVSILGVHAGGFPFSEKDPDVWQDVKIDTRLIPNYGVVIEEEVRAAVQ